MAQFLLKVKSKAGQAVLSSIVNGSSTVKELKHELSSLCKIASNNLIVLSGFPPKPLDVSNDDATLESLRIHSGDTLIVDEKAKPLTVTVDAKEDAKDIQENISGHLLKKVVPADNSCLFTSIGFVLTGQIDVTCGSQMRKIIATTVATDQVTYNEAILGRPNKEYSAWILRPNSWGGAIELAILSEFYAMEIVVVNTVNGIINRFGEDQNYTHRSFLIFDGLHYDPLYFESFEAKNTIQTVLPASNEIVLRQAELLAWEAQTSRQFTDVNKFSLKCLDCNDHLTGQAEAVAHGKKTGHNNFGEVSR